MYQFKKEAKFIPFSKINDNLLDKKILKRLEFIKLEVERLELANEDLEKIALRLFGFEIIKLDKSFKNCGGYCDLDDKKIALESNPRKTLVRKKFFCHELGHVIQAEVGILKKNKNFDNLLSYQVFIEQQCETIGSHLFDILFPADQKYRNRLKFKTYFTKEDHKFLLEWYRSLGQKTINDLIPDID